jgi:hypothetical protein
MANPYATPSLGTRWTDKQATTLARLNIARIQADYNTYALQQILDPDNPANGLSAGALLQGFALANVNYTSSAIDAHKIVPFFLDEPAHVSPTFNWQRAIRQTSWYAELGAPPTHGAFVINAAQDTIEWIDLDSPTLAVYMTFTAGAGSWPTTVNMIGANSGVTLTGNIAVLDFKVIVCNGSGYGITIVDFLADNATYISNEHKRYLGDISERNNGNGVSGDYTSNGLANTTVNAVAICRDPSGGTDHFGRPLHYWAAGTAAKISTYNPIANAIYDSADAQDAYDISCGAGGDLLMTQQFDPSDPDQVIYYGSVESMTADSFTSTSSIVQYVAGVGVSFLSATWFPLAAKLFYGVNGDSAALIGSDEGLTIAHNLSTAADHAFIHLTSTYITPYMKGTRAAAYPLDSLTDRSGNGLTLTNNGGTAFTGTSPFGMACANLDGVDDNLTVASAEFNFGTTDWTMSYYVKTTSATNPAASVTVVACDNGTIRIETHFETDGTMAAYITDDNGASADLLWGATGDIYDAEWHHIIFRRDGTALSLWADGIKIDSGTVAAAAGALNTGNLTIGNGPINGTKYLAGQVANVSMVATAWTDEEIKFEHSRMVAGLAGNTTLLTADDIDSVQVAPDGEYAIVTAGDVAHIMDPRTGIILSTDAVGAGTLNDAAIWQRAGADTPSYLLGASTTVEAVQPDERIGG